MIELRWWSRSLVALELLPMRTWTALGMAWLVGCATTATRHVYVPKSSAPCWRECKAMSLTCLSRPGVRPPATSYDPPSLAQRCETERLDCLLTCPGARETATAEEGN